MWIPDTPAKALPTGMTASMSFSRATDEQGCSAAANHFQLTPIHESSSNFSLPCQLDIETLPIQVWAEVRKWNSGRWYGGLGVCWSTLFASSWPCSCSILNVPLPSSSEFLLGPLEVIWLSGSNRTGLSSLISHIYMSHLYQGSVVHQSHSFNSVYYSTADGMALLKSPCGFTQTPHGLFPIIQLPLIS